MNYNMDKINLLEKIGQKNGWGVEAMVGYIFEQGYTMLKKLLTDEHIKELEQTPDNPEDGGRINIFPHKSQANFLRSTKEILDNFGPYDLMGTYVQYQIINYQRDITLVRMQDGEIEEMDPSFVFVCENREAVSELAYTLKELNIDNSAKSYCLLDSCDQIMSAIKESGLTGSVCLPDQLYIMDIHGKRE